MSEPSFDTLEDFKEWLVSSEGPGIAGAMPTKDSVTFIEGATFLTIYRRGAFQAELLCGQPGYRYTSHLSDTVDQCVIFMGGGITASTEYWEGTISEEEMAQVLEEYPETADDPTVWDAANASSGHSLDMPRGKPVSFVFGEKGGAFLLLSKYSEGTPQSNTIGMKIEKVSSSS